MKFLPGPLILLIIFCLSASSQKTYNVWAFGDKAGMDFNTTPPTPITTKSPAVKAPYYLSSVCNNSGELLFYTDGISVWDRANTELPKVNNRWPWKGKMIPLVCPQPGNDSVYYLFGISDGTIANALQYVQVKADYLRNVWIDYPAPAATSEFVKKLLDNCSMVIAGTNHCNEKDTWIVVHTPGKLNSFLISGNIVSPSPVVTDIDASLLPLTKINLGYSNFKFSANGEKMIISYPAQKKIIIYEFSKQTGIFSKPVSVRMPAGYFLEDAEISPDGRKLYFGAYEIEKDEPFPELHYVFQADLLAGNAAAIEQSIIKLHLDADRASCSPRSCFYVRRTLQLAPDGKIYGSMRELTSTALDKTTSIIEYPNAAGQDCIYRGEKMNLGKMYKVINYNYIRSGSYSLKENGIQVQKAVCSDMPAKFALLYTDVDSVKWDFGDAASGVLNFSNSLTPEHRYPGAGTYNVKAIIYLKCVSDTAWKVVVIKSLPAVQVPAFLKDTTVCTGMNLSLDVTIPTANSYTWENGLIYPQRIIEKAGTYSVVIGNECSHVRKTFSVKYEECKCESFIPTAFSPNYDGINDDFKPVIKCFASDYSFKVFNRWGGVVFNSKVPGKGWNGKIKQEPVSTGIYTWTLEYRNPNNKKFVMESGSVLLLR